MNYKHTMLCRSLWYYICGYQQTHGYSPSFEEMKAASGQHSKNGVSKMLGNLERMGMIRRLTNRARAIDVPFVPASLPHAPDGAPLYFVPVASLKGLPR